MLKKTAENTKLIHENFWIVLAFALSAPAVSKILKEQFRGGDWKFLKQSLHDRAEQRANRALMDMASQLRDLDNAEHISQKTESAVNDPLGTFVEKDGTAKDMKLRDMVNKVIHAKGFEWNFSDPEKPTVTCYRHDDESWQRAEIDLVAVAGLIGCLRF